MSHSSVVVRGEGATECVDVHPLGDLLVSSPALCGRLLCRLARRARLGPRRVGHILRLPIGTVSSDKTRANFSRRNDSRAVQGKSDIIGSAEGDADLEIGTNRGTLDRKLQARAQANVTCFGSR